MAIPEVTEDLADEFEMEHQAPAATNHNFIVDLTPLMLEEEHPARTKNMLPFAASSSSCQDLADGKKANKGTQHDSLLSLSEKESMGTYSLRLIEQLEMCEKIATLEDQTQEYQCGFCCAHCYQFTRFPRSTEKVADDLIRFQAHVRRCKHIMGTDTGSYIEWLEYHEQNQLDDSASKFVARHLASRSMKGNLGLRKMKRAAAKKRKTCHSVLETVESLR